MERNKSASSRNYLAERGSRFEFFTSCSPHVFYLPLLAYLESLPSPVPISVIVYLSVCVCVCVCHCVCVSMCVCLILTSSFCPSMFATFRKQYTHIILV